MICTTFLELNVVRNVEIKSQPESVSEFLYFVLCMFDYQCSNFLKEEEELLHFVLCQFSGILLEL